MSRRTYMKVKKQKVAENEEAAEPYYLVIKIIQTVKLVNTQIMFVKDLSKSVIICHFLFHLPLFYLCLPVS